MPRRLTAVIILAALGMADSLYGLLQHYGPTGSGACNWSGRVSCDLVNKSIFAEIGGVPVALIGLFGYLAILAAALWMKKNTDRHAALSLLVLAVGGLIFSFYLTAIELYWLRAYCPICLASQAIILAITVLAFTLWRQQQGTMAKI